MAFPFSDFVFSHHSPDHCSLTVLLLLSRSSRVQLCVTPETAAHQALPSLGFSRQEHWSGLPFPSPMHESEKWKWSRSVVSDSYRPHGLQPTRPFRPWDFPGKSTGVGCHCLLLPNCSDIYILSSNFCLHIHPSQGLRDSQSSSLDPLFHLWEKVE